MQRLQIETNTSVANKLVFITACQFIPAPPKPFSTNPTPDFWKTGLSYITSHSSPSLIRAVSSLSPPERVEITHFFSPIRSWTTQKELAHFLDSARNDARLPFMSSPGALLPLTGFNSRTCSSREEDHQSARSEDLQTFSKPLAFILFFE